MFNSAPQYLPWLALTGPLAVLSAGRVSMRKPISPPAKWHPAACGPLVPLSVALAVQAQDLVLHANDPDTGLGGNWVRGTSTPCRPSCSCWSRSSGPWCCASAATTSGDPDQGRFFKLLSLTLAAVLTLIISAIWPTIGAWLAASIGLGRLLCSTEPAAAPPAAKKKFLVSRIGDACLLGAILLFSAFGTLDSRPCLRKPKRPRTPAQPRRG